MKFHHYANSFPLSARRNLTHELFNHVEQPRHAGATSRRTAAADPGGATRIGAEGGGVGVASSDARRRGAEDGGREKEGGGREEEG